MQTLFHATIRISVETQLEYNTDKRVKVSKPAESSVNLRFNVASLFVAPVKRSTFSLSVILLLLNLLLTSQHEAITSLDPLSW